MKRGLTMQFRVLLSLAVAYLSLCFLFPFIPARDASAAPAREKAGADSKGAKKPSPEESQEEEEEEAEDEEGEEAEAGDDDSADGDSADDASRRKEAERTSTAGAEPPLERLLELNSAQLFGGKVKVTGEAFEVTFSADGEMAAGFEGKGIIDSKGEQMRGVSRRFIQIEKKDDQEVLVPGLSAVGMGEGVWTSRFPVAGNPWVEFGMRVPNLIGSQSNIKIRVNWQKGSGYETNFFNSVSYIAGGNIKSLQSTPIKEYQPPTFKWFPRKDRKVGLKIGFGIRDGKCSVKIGGREVASLPKAIDKGGKIIIVYSKLTFTIDNLKVSGQLDRKWAEEQIASLRKSGKLKLKPDPDPDRAARQAGG
ncbi:MAG TPA: hypothetical protein VMT52_07575 [Planctomycetota bacterium]|nr:hypothetical protein [Planctomycetota bacterium]